MLNLAAAEDGVTPDRRADLAESMVPVACDLACRVRDGDAEGIARLLASLGAEKDALLVVLAAMVPVEDASPNELLAWTAGLETSVEWRQAQLPLAARLALLPPRELEPCPSLAAYRRHRAAGEPYEDCGCGGAARTAWRARKRLRAAEEASNAA